MKRHLLGLEFADMNLPSTAAWCLARDPALAFSYVVTPNADHITRLRRMPHLLPLYQDASLCLLDSQLVHNIARLLGLRPPCVTTGADLTATLLLSLSEAGAAVMIIGLDAVHLKPLQARYPGLRLAHHNPPMGFIMDTKAVARAVSFVRDHPTPIVLLAVGSPQQEILANAIQKSGTATGLGLCIGAAALFATEAVKRAPYFMRRIGMEWAYRLGQEPGRLAHRYLIDDPPVLGALVREALIRKMP